MIKALIVDDEKIARQTLSALIDKYCKDIQIIGFTEDVEEAEKLIIQAKPEIVFLDIEMPGKNGFELLELFQNPTFEVIFTTAYQEYALKAFRYAAIDYLQKPIDFRLLIQAIGRYKQKEENRFQKERYELLLKNMHFNTKELIKIAIPTSEGYTFTQLADIVYCKASKVYSEISLLNGETIYASISLKELEELFPENIFFRCHKSYLLNLNHCIEYTKSEDMILMLNHDLIPLSQRLKGDFFERFKQPFSAVIR